MKSRLHMLKRIEAVYGLVEEMHSVALRRAAAKVSEAEKAIDEQCTQAGAAAKGTHAALVEGDREQRVVTLIQRELSGRRRSELDVVRLERERVTDRARVDYGASRIRSEQMKSVVEQNEAAAQLIMERRMQAAADDRFLSRLRWNQMQREGR